MLKNLLSWFTGTVVTPKWLWFIMMLCFVVTLADGMEKLYKKILKREK